MDVAEAARQWLRDRGAQEIPHAGGSLYDHLGRVHDRLRDLGAGPDLRLAGLTHAAYGTDGFATALLDVAHRDRLRRLVGEPAEAIVYRYGGCDRGHTWRALSRTGQIRSRFTQTVEAPTAAQLRAFVDLSIVNELDVALHDPAIAREHGDYFRSVFGSWAVLASPAVIMDARRVLTF
ncbi:hypothetical protein GCM10012284_19270 [Mangrovihabitans endophyticus]|uniref:DUF6817 domain-containing protein n=2 Tax=Mangrovihabitans endophyticus TaxID=1751298 RepID=A0A8J3BYM0_9ACTN|nr:hypothetical protein GCM10012284_19270 [Mangrovihabitans endophyticus]